MKGWPESHDETKETLLGLACQSASHLQHWQDFLSLIREFAESRALRGADATEVTLTRFREFFPLLYLRKYDEARILLQQCLDALESARSYKLIPMIHLAFGFMEDQVQHFDEAVSHVSVALRLNYAAGSSGCAMCHYNLGIYLSRTNFDTAVVIAHLLAGALISYQTSGDLRMSIDALRTNLAKAPSGAIPANFDGLCQIVEQTEGVRFRDLFSKLPQRAASGDEALHTILDMINSTATLA